MASHVAKSVVQKLIALDKTPRQSRILIMGVTFKENVSDIRNSKVVDVYRELKEYGLNVEVVDPYASPEEVREEYHFDLSATINPRYDCIIVAVNHEEYARLDEKYFRQICVNEALIVDLKGIFRGKIKELNYWSL
jgi:UDP-N-acetyl-D-galactosamine dehydrogenase